MDLNKLDKNLIKLWTATNFKINEGKKYTNKELVFITENCQVSLISILKTQNLTSEYCKKYLLDKNNKYSVKDIDNNLSIRDILYYQKHLKYNDLI